MSESMKQPSSTAQEVDAETRVHVGSNGSGQLAVDVKALSTSPSIAQRINSSAAVSTPGGHHGSSAAQQPQQQQHLQDDDSHSHEAEDPDKPPLEPPFGNNRGFMLALAVALLTGGLMGLLCLGYLKAADTVPEMLFQADGNESFPDDPDTLTYVSGKPWWIAVGAGVGLFTGLVKALTDMDQYPSILKEIQAKHVDAWMSTRVFVLCLASILGGAPIGPEAGLGSMGMLIGQTAAQLVRRFKVPGWEAVDPSEFTIVGVSAALSPVVPSPIIAMILCGELGGWPSSRQAMLWFAGSMASFAVYWSVLERTYINPVVLAGAGAQARQFTSYDFAIALLLGLMGAVVSLAYFLIAGVSQAVFGKLKQRLEAKIGRRGRIFTLCLLSGCLFGLFNYLFPLAVGSGQVVLGSIMGKRNLSTGLLISSAAIKALSFWICAAGGLVGGFVLPILTIGTMIGSAVAAWTGANRVLVMSSSFVALAAGFCPIPVFLIVLTFVCFPISQLALFTVTCTVYMSYFAFVGVGVPHALMERAQRKKQ